MPEFSGSLQAIELSSFLWLVPLLPLLVAAISAVGRAAPGEDKPRPLAVHWHLEAALGALVLLAFQVVHMATLASGRRFLLDTLFTALRVGSLDVALSLSLDPLSAAVGLLVGVCGAVVIAHVVLPGASRSDPATARRCEALSLGLGSMLLLVLASNLALLLVGWAGASLAGYLLAAPLRGRTLFALGRFADLALLAGAVLLFWTLGGAWSQSGEFTPDFQARLVAVHSKPAPPPAQPDESMQHPAAMGELSMNALPGATVGIKGAKLCQIGSDGHRGGLGVPAAPCKLVAHAPFERLPIPLAMHNFRIELGPGENPLVVRKVEVAPDDRIQLAVAGPTLDFRQMRDELVMRDQKGGFPLRTNLASKQLWGLSALTLALALMALAGLVKCLQWPFGGGLSARESWLLAGGGGLVAGVYLLARLAFYFPLAPAVGGLIALFGAVTAVVAGLLAVPLRDPGRVAMAFAVGQIGLSLVGIGSGAVAAGVLQLAVVVPAALALVLAANALEEALGTKPDLAKLGGLGSALPRTGRTWFIAALAATAAPYPFLGAFWSRESVLWGAFTSLNTGFVPGSVVFALGVIGAAALCFAVWRAYFLVFTGKAASKGRPRVKTQPSTVHARLLLGLAELSLIVGLLEASDRVLDSASPVFPALLDAWFSPMVHTGGIAFSQLGTGIRLGLMLVGFGVPLFAWSAARRRYGAGREKGWADKERRTPLFGWLERGDPVPRLMAPLARGVAGVGTALVRLDGVLAFGGESENGDEGDEGASDSHEDEPEGDGSHEDEGEAEGADGDEGEDEEDEAEGDGDEGEDEQDEEDEAEGQDEGDGDGDGGEDEEDEQDEQDEQDEGETKEGGE